MNPIESRTLRPKSCAHCPAPVALFCCFCQFFGYNCFVDFFSVAPLCCRSCHHCRMLHRIPLAAALFAVCLPLSPPYWPYVPLLFLFLGNRRESTHKFAVFVSLFSWRSHVCERVLTLFLYISHSLLRFHQENEKVTFLRASLIGCTHRSSRSFSRHHQCPSSISIFPSLQEQHIFCFSRRETHPFYCLCDVGGWRCCWTHLVG